MSVLVAESKQQIEKILKDYGDDFKIKFARHTGKRLDDK